MFKLFVTRTERRIGLAWLTKGEGLKYPLLWEIRSQIRFRLPVPTAGR